MNYASGSREKRISLRRYPRRFSLAVRLLLFLPVVAFSFIFVPSSHALVTSHVLPTRNSFSISPTQGPVGTVITVSGTNLTYPDGTQISLGYTTDFVNCVAVADSQVSTVSNRSFSGWLRWPTATGTGSFGVCAVASGFFGFLERNFNVLSDTPPQITVAPTIPDAGKQATVTGANFLPGGATVNLVWQSPNTGQTVALGSATSDDTGAFTQTFTVPPNSSTGTYSMIADSGTGQPPALSASTTFQVNGITIAPVSTPNAKADPTTSTTPASSPTVTTISTTNSNSTGIGGNTSVGTNNKSGLLMPIILGGLLLIIVTLIAGVLLVRRQRNLALIATSNTGQATSSVGPDNLFGQGDAAYSPTNPQFPTPLTDRLHGSNAAKPGEHVGTFAFDADLAEAMRQAQVSIFAMPKPSMD